MRFVSFLSLKTMSSQPPLERGYELSEMADESSVQVIPVPPDACQVVAPFVTSVLDTAT